MSKAEEFIEENTRSCSNLAHFGDINGNVWEENTPWLTPEEARKAVEIAREEIYEWLKEHSQEYVYWMDEELEKMI